ncbi:MAG: hypothetical protein QOE61_1491 [Micromonosporaceae bacterium]|nr:hypothetical protein [Micromonosporaceae bacterium]
MVQLNKRWISRCFAHICRSEDSAPARQTKISSSIAGLTALHGFVEISHGLARSTHRRPEATAVLFFEQRSSSRAGDLHCEFRTALSRWP